ncbi:EF-hand domain-containing protein, partial [Salmonella sp. s51933]|uniref:EF-hand domain-containing protein n=1 Tax=Salmonella sp. s51933 TaxID=3160127 RepID=UPI0037550C8E
LSDTEAAKEAFDLFDKDKNGTISRMEIAEVLKSMGQTFSDEQIKETLKNIDTNNDGVLNTQEFEKFLAECDRNNEKELREAFNTFDKDGSNFVTKDELSKVMKACGEKVSDEDLTKMIKAADTSGDGKISFDEFKKMMGQ